MDNTPQQLLKLAKQLRDDLNAIGIKLDNLHNDLSRLPDTLNQNQVDAIREYAEANKKSGDVPIPISTPVAIGVEAETRERKDVPYWLFKGIEILGIAAVIVYAAVTYSMWDEMTAQTAINSDIAQQARLNGLQADKSLKATIERFHTERRPWVGVETISPDLIAPGIKLQKSITVKNFGNGPALNMNIRLVYRTLDKPITEATATLPPPPWPKLIKYVLMPGDRITSQPAVSGTFIGKDTNGMELFRQGVMLQYLYGVISYDDEFGAHHVTEFCSQYDPKTTNEMVVCPINRTVN